MFTGLVREIGTVADVKRLNGGFRYGILCPETAADLKPGASVAVDGICQTVSGFIPGGFTAEAVAATLSKTNLCGLRKGCKVNIEPALRAGDPLDGHILQGHVQGTGRLVSVERRGIAVILRIQTDTGPEAGIISEGSVGVNGISLTVAVCGQGEFSVSIIPETWNATAINQKKPGDRLNIEGDFLLRGSKVSAGLDSEKLREWGY